MNQQIIITAIMSIVGAVGLLFAKKWVETYFKVYPPDIKKHISFIKKFAAFVFSYVLPIGTIVFLAIWYKKVDRFFIISIVFNTAVVVIHLMLFFIFKIWKQQSIQFEWILKSHEHIGELLELDSSSEKNITGILGMIKDHNHLISFLSDRVDSLEAKIENLQK
jgi:hypothetical protein